MLLLMFCWLVGVLAALPLLRPPVLPPPLFARHTASLAFSASATVVPFARLVLLGPAAENNSAAIFVVFSSFCCFFLVLDRDKVRIS